MEGFLLAAGPQLRWSLEADGTRDWRWGHLLHPVLGLKIELRQHDASEWVTYLLRLLCMTALCRGGQESRPILRLQDLSLIKPRARRPRIPGEVIKTTEGYLE